MPERRLVRKGNRQYERGDYDNSIDNYSRALRYDPKSFEAKFNTANVQFRRAFADSVQLDVKMIEKAEQTLRKLAQDSTRTDIERADVAYNLGNSLFMQQKFKEALVSYRDAMRLNPDDQEAKYNYALTKEMLKQQQQQQQNQQQQQDQNQDNQNQEQEQNQDNQQDKQDKEDQQNKEDKQNQQPNEQQISEQEQQAMLEAIQAQEDKTQEKLKEKQGVIIRGGKNW
ncbi:MAG: tetratricopeptide repeat protein [Alistipes sp.]|nr:tetratricopeptide repeat protein [Alistipes sp.]